ncbi:MULTISPECIES: hypothetical protein [unclassified Streptomyces]|uniref:hypothetical protein n=1 Tax=unclassified Streptomyces TaxID=2593676 RepID=UPI0033B881AC
MEIPLTFVAPGGDEDDHAQGAVGKLTSEQIASFAPGLFDMEPVPTPTELKDLATAAQDHPSVVLPAEILRALFAGTTHPDELLDQLDHPEAVAQQLNTRPGRSRQKSKRKVSRLGRLARLSTNTGYAAVVRSPLHQIAGIMTLPVNPRFLAAIQHAFTKGRTTDPTIEGSIPGLLEIHLPAKQDLVDLITTTVTHHLLDYDWSDSIARTGVQEPLTCMALRVHYADGTSEVFVVAIDGQSRLTSAWRNVLGIGDKKLTAATAPSYAEKIVGRMFAHDAVAASRKAVNGALNAARASSWTANELETLHSRLAPVNLVVGTYTRLGEPCEATTWFTEHLTQIHLRPRHWSGGSDQEKAVADAMLAAVHAGKITPPLASALSGRLHGLDFTHATGLPHHPAFARALLFETVLSADAGALIRSAIAEGLSLDPSSKDFPAKLLKTTAIFSTRYLRSDAKTVFPNMVHTWDNGGSITRTMWNRLAKGADAFTLTRLRDDQLDDDPYKSASDLVEQLRRRAEDDVPGARDELAVLGGDALTVAETLGRDRGSKEDLVSEEPVNGKTPYRSRPPGVVAALIETPAGRLLLGAALSSWVDQVPGHPADYSRQFTVPEITTTPDGTPVIATTHGNPRRATEWHVFELAWPGLPTSRRAVIEGRRDVARQVADEGGKSQPKAASIKALQTAVGRLEQTIASILTSPSQPKFADGAQQEALQKLLFKASLDIGKIPVVVPASRNPYPNLVPEDGEAPDGPTPGSGDPYALPEDGR